MITPVTLAWFDRPALALAQALVGALILRRLDGLLLVARIVETEAYATAERASHSSLGRTPSREPMFGPPGTIYMYRSRGGPSLNVSARGAGDAVLLKGALLACEGPAAERMHALNPDAQGGRRPDHRLLAGQSLLCRALDLQTAQWTGRAFGGDLAIGLDDEAPEELLQTRRLGIPSGRDEQLPWRFVDAARADAATKDPRRARSPQTGGIVARVRPSG